MYGISVDGDAAGVEVKRRECEDNGSIEKKMDPEENIESDRTRRAKNRKSGNRCY